MPGTPIRVLTVDDNPDDAMLIDIELRKGGFEPQMFRVQTAEAMREALETREFDIVLSDYTMPRFDALQALDVLKATGIDLPFIMISGSVGEELAVRAMKGGAHDYFMKGSLGLLPVAVERELREARHRRTAREQRRQLIQQEKLAAMGTLLAAVAHELNNPLAVVVAQAGLLQRMLDRDPRQVRSEQILEAAERCARIVRNFLAMARQQPPERARVSVNQIVEDTIEILAYGLRVDNIELQLDLSDPAPIVCADALQLQQILVNFITNAQDALRQRSDKRLSISSRMSGNTVILRIADNGEGIPPQILSRIFEPFFTTKPVGQGTGLGLALCQGMIESHGGSVSVESEVGKGTTFRVELPASSAAERGDESLEQQMPRVVGKRILVVDDEPAVASALSDVLTMEGHRVKVAADGATALRLLETAAYDVVMSDVRMPGMDGPALYREIVVRHPSLERRFVFLSGDTFHPDTDRFLKETRAARLNKPCSYEEIVEVVAQLFAETPKIA